MLTWIRQHPTLTKALAVAAVLLAGFCVAVSAGNATREEQCREALARCRDQLGHDAGPRLDDAVLDHARAQVNDAKERCSDAHAVEIAALEREIANERARPIASAIPDELPDAAQTPIVVYERTPFDPSGIDWHSPPAAASPEPDATCPFAAKRFIKKMSACGYNMAEVTPAHLCRKIDYTRLSFLASQSCTVIDAVINKK